MFDDPRKKLHWMEEELLSEEEDKEADDLMDRVDALLADEEEEEFSPRIRRRQNPAMDVSRTVYGDEGFDEDAAVPPEPKKKGIGGLVLLAILETAAIVAIARWWLQWL